MNQDQVAIAHNVRDRGYWDGLEYENLACRHIAKLVEEIAEAAELLDGRFAYWRDHITESAKLARNVFDRRELWESYTITDLDKFKTELADIQVVLFSLATVLEFDVIQAALEKSCADVGRGIRQ